MQVLSPLKSGLKTLVDTLKVKPSNAENVKRRVSRKYGVDLTTAQLSNITDEVALSVVGDVALLLRIEFSNYLTGVKDTQVINVTDYALPVNYGGVIYQANNQWKSMSNFNSTTQISSRGITFSLSAMNKAIYNQVFAYGYLNAPVKVLLAYVDDSGTAIGAVDLFNGFVETVKLVNDGKSKSFNFTVNNVYGRLDKTSGKRTANGVQHLIDPNDKGFEWVARTKAEEKWKAD